MLMSISYPFKRFSLSSLKIVLYLYFFCARFAIILSQYDKLILNNFLSNATNSPKSCFYVLWKIFKEKISNTLIV